MNNAIVSLLLLAIAGIALPVGYLAVCLRLRKLRAWSFLYFAYFCLFGTLGGWVFVFAMSPSGIAATSMIFLLTIALAACLGSAIAATFRKEKSWPEWTAIVGGYSYPVYLGVMIGIGALLDSRLS